MFGESFGGVFAPGLTWMSGAPGAALLYCVAGVLIALPVRAWRPARLGRFLLPGTGLLLLGMAVLQAWPGRGFWQGTLDGRPATLTGMIQAMSTTAQPRPLAEAVAGFGAFTAAHGFAVNLFAVGALAVIGASFASGRPALARVAVTGFTVLCLADWVLVQDLGFLGGLGTDPNSMIPYALLAWAGYAALPRPLTAAANTGAPPASDGTPSCPAGADGVTHLAISQRQSTSHDMGGVMRESQAGPSGSGL